MSKQPWFPFYVGSYLKNTTHLSQAEHGAYILLLCYYYSKGKPIPDDRKYAIAHAHALQEHIQVDNVLKEFFILKDGVWVNERCELELIRQKQLVDKRKEAAKARWDKGNANGYASALQKHTHSHSPKGEYKKKENAWDGCL